jgi:hypothetical protein
MADIAPDQRDAVAQALDCKRCAGSGDLSAAPNDDMPNSNEYDFRCRCGHLYNLRDLSHQFEQEKATPHQ